jgi:hypothetical protein
MRAWGSHESLSRPKKATPLDSGRSAIPSRRRIRACGLVSDSEIVEHRSQAYGQVPIRNALVAHWQHASPRPHRAAGFDIRSAPTRDDAYLKWRSDTYLNFLPAPRMARMR